MGQSAGVLRLDGTIIANPPIATHISIAGSALHPVPTTVVAGYATSPVHPSSPA